MARPKKIERIKVQTPNPQDAYSRMDGELKQINKAVKLIIDMFPDYIPSNPNDLWYDVESRLRDISINKNQPFRQVAENNGWRDPFFRLTHLLTDAVTFTPKHFQFIHQYKEVLSFDKGTSQFIYDAELLATLWQRDGTIYLEGKAAVELYSAAQDILTAIDRVKELAPQSFKDSFAQILKGHSHVLTVVNGEPVVNWRYIKDLQTYKQI